MITKEEIQELLHSNETYRVERTTSTGDMDKFQETICAFANDLPNSRKKGYLILGAYDNGTLSGLKVTDDLLKKIAAIRSNGNILPIPVMSVESFQFPEGDLLVAEVSPSDLPPVRYRGRSFIRIGPRRDIATEAEERILAERRMSFMATFDTTPCFSAKLGDINTDLLRPKYLEPLLGKEVVATDNRSRNRKKPVFVSVLREEMINNYPYYAIRELLLNACMHRDLQSNTPLRFYEFASHLEILNAGGLYGNARPENFPRVNDYRNPLIASAMKTMGYVNMFNRGVGQVQTDLKENGNPPAKFDVSLITAFRVDVKSVASKNSSSYPISTHDVGDDVGDRVGDDVVDDVVDDIRNVVKAYSSQLSERQITVIELMVLNPFISAREMSLKLSMTSRTIERDIAKIKKLGIVEREGDDHGGTWKVLVPHKGK